MLSKIYTPKQIEILKACRNTDWFMLINHGAKRSGKTQLDNDLFLEELRKVRQTADTLGIDTPQYILAGYSLGNIQDNILTELSNKYGFEFKFDKYNNFNLFGVKVIQTSHGSISGLRKTFQASIFNSLRLLWTELARVQTAAQMQSYKDNGFAEYEYLTARDFKVCATCKALDGKIFKVDEEETGTNSPPMHPCCRCSTTAHMDLNAYEKWLDGYSEHGINRSAARIFYLR